MKIEADMKDPQFKQLIEATAKMAVEEYRNQTERPTLRDQFAMSCPVTLTELARMRDDHVTPFDNNGFGLFMAYCQFRYDYADAMMEAREAQ